ncbi:hypothetical protein ABFG93_17465 [Pseudalkalibacillus hwajinpoensis]|uniref:hypothetical protein n=1 Tax=Guptibacillus hwajinpoensis TaxID=208199 RepID=UPI00325BEA3D
MYSFKHDERLQISVPVLEGYWEDLPHTVQATILFKWEQTKSSIPDRIAELEHFIIEKQEQLNREADFQRSCLLNAQIAELASIINDLWIWYRKQMLLTKKD